MNRSLLTALSAAAAIVSLAACNSSSTPSPGPTPGPTCTLPPGVATVMVYPAPSATAVNNTSGTVVIGSTTALDPAAWQLVITDAVWPGGLASGTLTTVSPPFPTPNATPSFPNPQYQQGAFGAPFAANQVVTVYVNNFKAANNCTPLKIGTFGT